MSEPADPGADEDPEGTVVSVSSSSSAELAAKVAFLRRPGSYPEHAGPVEAVETHMAWVFLTDRHAFKLKKPVRYGFLDFSTPDARRRTCEAEVRLNRRLAPDVYVGLVPLTEDSEGRMAIGGPATTIDWLVQMRRLPADRMLDVVIEQGTVEDADLERLGRILADFYREAPVADLDPAGYRERLRRDLDTDLSELRRPEFGLPAALIGEVASALRGFLEDHAGTVEGRAAEGRVVEGHGDLRPEHVCLEERPVVIDCIEFNRDFRTVDPADDLAFLWLECERLDAGSVGARVLDVYADATCDRPPEALLDFYMGCRACLRAKLSAWHTTDSAVDDHGTWLEKARRYLRLAAGHAGRLP